MILTREDVLTAWAHIEAKRGSMYGPQGLVVRENQDVRSHRITIRYRTDVDIKSTAWVNEARLKSPPRWFKVLGVTDGIECFILDVRLVERSETAMSPVASNVPAAVAIKPRATPDKVKL